MSECERAADRSRGLQAEQLQGRQRGLDQQADRRGLAPADLVRPCRHADPPFYTGNDSCPLVDLDGETPPVYNDCNTPLQSRLFRRPFFDTPDLGHAVPDWEAYWTDTANHRTRAFEWDWRNQDYPHPDGTRYEPPTEHARVRVWVRPEGFVFNLYPIPTHYSDVMNIEAALIPRVWALLTNYDIEYLFPTSPLVPDNPLGPFGPVGPVGPVFVHPLAWGRDGAEVEPYLWADPPEDAATAGLLVKRFNPVNGEIYDPVTHEEQDLECLPLTVGKSSAIEYLTLGSTGIAAQLSVTSIAPYAWFHSFSDASFGEVSASAAWFTHMSGPRLVWAEAMAQSQIVLYDTVTKVKTVLDPQPHGQWLPRIDGDRIVWVDHRNAPGDMVNQGNSDIYLHDLSSGKSTPVTINAARQDHPDVDGDWVVWEDWRNNPNPTPRYSGEFKESDIFALNLKTGKEIQVTNLPGMELNPKVDGDRVFYIKGPLIFMKNLR